MVGSAGGAAAVKQSPGGGGLGSLGIIRKDKVAMRKELRKPAEIEEFM